MKKRHAAALAAAAGTAAWCAWRDRRYPLPKGYRAFNKVIIPPGLLAPRVVAAGNRVLARMPLPELPCGLKRERVSIRSEDGTPVALTIYCPGKPAQALPCVIYCHGGGFAFGEAGYLHQYAARYSGELGCKVVLVHYRTTDLAPFPAAFQDCYAAVRWAWHNSAQLGIDRSRIAVAGDSAGGCLAAACALRARDEGQIRLCFQLLIYPVTDCRMVSPSMARFWDSPLWNAGLNRRMWARYLPGGNCLEAAAYASPARARDLAGLPPAFVEVEEFDCLRDEGIAYARALERAGCSVELELVRGGFHGFDILTEHPLARRAFRRRCQALGRSFGIGKTTTQEETNDA